jgi:glycosyltransferase involved in cell wall biosynthesis
MQVAGAEVLVAETIRRLGSKLEPVILCLDGIGALGEQLRGEGVDVICLDRKKSGRDWGVIRRLVPVLNQRRVEVLHAHQYSPFFYAALAKPFAQRRTRVILTEHGRHYPDVASPLRRAINRLVFSQLADDINACADFSARALTRVDGFPGRRISVIPNGIDVERYHTGTEKPELRRRLGLDPGRRYVIHVARFHPIKDHAMLLRAFAGVASDCDDVDLLLAGDGPLRGEMERLVDALGLNGRMRFLGVRSDVPVLLQAADIFTLTSISEAASLTLLEAMAAGLPIVATAVGGTPELVRDGREALLVPRGDHVAAATALRTVLQDPALATRLGEAARARVRARFRLDDTIANYDRLYRRLCR